MISFPKIALDENLKSGYLDFAKPADIVCFTVGSTYAFTALNTAEKGRQKNQHVRGDCGKVSRS